MVVLVTGSNGQLGQSLQYIADNYPEIQFKFCHSETLNITNLENIESVFENFKPAFCINAAAYTAVDKAETDTENAFNVNVNGPKNLAIACKKHQTKLIHVSTDFVFDGNLEPKANPKGYSETDAPNPTGVYGQTKLDGENAILNSWEQHFIIRTSWVYSQFGNNFLKTMLRFGRERDTLSVVEDQIGTPTNAVDLANVLVQIVLQSTNSIDAQFGIYNFSNEGQCSWYEFAKEIFDINNVTVDLKPIPTTSYPTPAKRPQFSVLDKSKIKNNFKISINPWQESLKAFVLE